MVDEYGFFRGKLWSALTVRIASVTSVKVARRGTFGASTSLPSAADTSLRQSGDQVPSLDGQYALIRSCGLRGGMRQSRTANFSRSERSLSRREAPDLWRERHFWT